MLARHLATVLAGLLLPGCATSHLARPVGRGNTRVNLSVGGPVARVRDLPLPVPLTTVGVAHGLTDAVDVHADVHPFAALFNPGDGSAPVLGMDLGVAVHPIERHRAALTVGGALYGFGNRRDAVLFSDLWLASGMYPTRWLWLSVGVHNMVRMAVSDQEVRERSPWSPTAFVQLAVLAGRVQIELEGRWYAFTENGRRATPDFYSIGELGALGILLGLNYQFEGSAR